MKSYSAILILVCAGCITSQQQKLETVLRNAHLARIKQQKILEQQKIQECVKILQAHYLDSFVYDPLHDTTVAALTSRLDPYTFYRSAQETKEFLSYMDYDEDDCLGVYMSSIQDTQIVTYVIPGSAAQELNILPGDRILSLDKTSLIKKSERSIDSIFRSALPCKSVILRPKEWKKYTVKLYTYPVRPEFMGRYFMLDDTTGYLAFRHFSRGAYRGVLQSLRALTEGGMKQLVFDMRNNSGGFLDEAIDIVGLFVADHRKVLEHRSVHERQYVYEYSRGKGEFSNLPVAIIVNNESASAAEVVAGALQDLDRAVIVGSPSYGKGLCQMVKDLPDGLGSLNVTMTKLCLPSGRSVQMSYEGAKKKKVRIPTDSFIFNLDHHIERSFALSDTTQYRSKNGRILYGGMGVIPDVFAPWFTNKPTRRIAYNDSLQAEVFRYHSENHQLIYEEYATLDSFITEFPKSSAWRDIKKFIERQVQFRAHDSTKALINVNDVLQFSLWHIASRYYGESEVSPALMQTDKRVIAARNFLGTQWKLLVPPPPQPVPPPVKKIKKWTQK